jgi:hypothetical protein
MWAMTQKVARPIVDTFVARIGAAIEAHDTFDRLGVGPATTGGSR